MTRFILNDKTIATDLPAGTVLLDFIRYHQHLAGTKIGCREGDCGACTILVGSIDNGEPRYQSATSCLMPLGNAAGKHIVTIEGINFPDGRLNPVQKAMADEGATQCGFCTPGFVMSLAGFCLDDKPATGQRAMAAIDGNICRCTGYKSIERAAGKVAELLKDKGDTDPCTFVNEQQILPAYFTTIKNKLLAFDPPVNLLHEYAKQAVGGGTDLYVQKHDEMTHADIRFMAEEGSLKEIIQQGNHCIIGAAATVTDLCTSPLILDAFPDFLRYAKLVSSTPIRNMATIAGNFVNASPIGDFTIFFLALDAQLELVDSVTGKTRMLPLRRFYKGYKQLDKTASETIRNITIELPEKNSFFHFEKVSKRTHLDIASVNSAIALQLNGNTIQKAGVSAGGVGHVPMYLEKASAFISGKSITEELVNELISIVQSEISPISDARGSKEYKRLLLGQLIKAHFLELSISGSKR